MSNNRITRVRRKAAGIAALLTMMLLAAGAIFSGPAAAAPAAQMGSMTDMLRPLSGEQFEKQFLNMMIMHHMSAVEMAQHEVDRGAHAELKATAQKIIDDQTREINEMTGWLKSWYNTTPQHDMSMMGDMSMMQNMASLSGDALDKEFLVQMRMHHMSAVEMAGLVPDRATHAELKTLGQNIISSQQAEIKQFESWLAAWYNADPSGAAMPMGNMPAAATTPVPQAGMPATGAGDGAGSLLPLLLTLAAILLAGGALLSGFARLRRRA